MKQITKTTHYWLFKKVNSTSEYYFVRTIVVGVNEEEPSWFVGRENHMGLVSSVGGDLSDDTKQQLELEFNIFNKL